MSTVISPEYDTTINLSSGSSATINVTIPVVTSGTYSVSSAGTKHIYKYTSISVPAGSVSISNTSATITPAITVSADGVVTATASGSASVTPTITAGYISSASAGNVTITGSSSTQLSTQGATTITPTETQQTAVASGKYTTGAITVAGISSDYIGTAVSRLSSADLTVSGSTVTAPSGFYSSNASANVAAGSAFTPATTITTNPSITVSSNGLITATVSNYRNITPTVNAGYIVSGTSGRVQASGSNTYQLTVRGASSYTPTTTAQTIPSGIYLTGTQTINAIPSQYIVPAGTLSISANANGIDVSQYASVDVNVPTPSFVTYYTGSSAPSNSLGSNGDIYLQTTE